MVKISISLTGSDTLKELEQKIMAKFSEVLTAIASNGLGVASIIETVAVVSADVKALLEKQQNGEPISEAELQGAIDSLNSQGESLTQAKQAILQIIPTVPSPTPDEPAPVGEPLPQPAPVPDEVTPDDVVVTPSDLGTEGSVNVDLA